MNSNIGCVASCSAFCVSAAGSSASCGATCGSSATSSGSGCGASCSSSTSASVMSVSDTTEEMPVFFSARTLSVEPEVTSAQALLASVFATRASEPVLPDDFIPDEDTDESLSEVYGSCGCGSSCYTRCGSNCVSEAAGDVSLVNIDTAAKPAYVNITETNYETYKNVRSASSNLVNKIVNQSKEVK